MIVFQPPFFRGKLAVKLRGCIFWDDCNRPHLWLLPDPRGVFFLEWHIWKTNLSWPFREFARHLRSFRFLLCQKALYISKVLLSFALPLLLSTFQIWAPRSKLESGQLCGTCEMPSWWQKSMKYTWIHLSMARWWFQIFFFWIFTPIFFWGTCHHFDKPQCLPRPKAFRLPLSSCWCTVTA